jgi:TatD DNase family protein
MTQFLVDSHCHLDDTRFDADRDEVIDRARAQGLRWLLTVGGGSGPDDLAAGIPIAARYDWIYTSVGIHPHEARRAEEQHLEMLRQAAGERKVVAVGEIGLDYYYDHSPSEVQKQVLASQLEIAQEANLPVIIHCRDAWEDLKEIVGSMYASRGLRGILHCFTGSREDAFTFLDWGFLVSFAGNVTFKKADSLRAVAGEIPRDRLLAETDSPYLAPEPNRGKRNEPAFVHEVIRRLADLHHMSAEEMGALTTKNFGGLLGLE